MSTTSLMTSFKRMALLAILVPAVAIGCHNPADDAPAADVQEAAVVDTPVAATSAVTYDIAESSLVEFVGSKVTGNHEGGFKVFAGEISVEGGSPESSKVRVVIDTTSLWSDNDNLTEHLKSADFFDVETYPTAIFESTGVTADGAGGYTLTGNLDLHGVTKQISFPATITVGEGEVRASAEFSIKRFDFGIEYAGRADDLIRDDVLIKLDLVGTPLA